MKIFSTVITLAACATPLAANAGHPAHGRWQTEPHGRGAAHGGWQG